MGIFLPFLAVAGTGTVVAYRDKFVNAWNRILRPKGEYDLSGAFNRAVDVGGSAIGLVKKGAGLGVDTVDFTRRMATGKDATGREGSITEEIGNVAKKAANKAVSSLSGDNSNDDGDYLGQLGSAISGGNSDEGINWKGTLWGAGGAGLLALVSKKLFGTGFTGPFLLMALSAFSFMNFDKIKEFGMDVLGIDENDSPRKDVEKSAHVDDDRDYNPALDMS